MKKALAIAAVAGIVLSAGACLGKGKGKAPPPPPAPAAIVTKG
ncbi:ABC transporter [Enterovirga sp.]|nr:ABC transporter [Enterovirga sp.]HMO27884.1 ABC transporter [Enterovirga sp.]